MNTCDCLAVLGYDAILATLGGPTDIWCDDDYDKSEYEAATEAARRQDHAKVLQAIIDAECQPRAADLSGVRWIRLITWPDRVPGLITWAGQSNLSKIVNGHRKRLKKLTIPEDVDLYTLRGMIDTGKGEGPSGLDSLTCQDAIDVGFSLRAAGMSIECRPAVELLAIVGLEAVPIVSYGPRECGVVHDGACMRWTVEPRSGGYFHRWGDIKTEGVAQS